MKSCLPYLVALLAATPSVVHSFTTPAVASAMQFAAPTTTTTTPLYNSPPLNQVDEMCIENVAEFCLDAAMECDLEEFEALVNQLTEQRKYHAEQVQLIDGLLGKLAVRSDSNMIVNGAGPSP